MPATAAFPNWIHESSPNHKFDTFAYNIIIEYKFLQVQSFNIFHMHFTHLTNLYKPGSDKHQQTTVWGGFAWAHFTNAAQYNGTNTIEHDTQNQSVDSGSICIASLSTSTNETLRAYTWYHLMQWNGLEDDVNVTVIESWPGRYTPQSSLNEDKW